MSEYRFYVIENDGHITHPAKVLECQIDEAAIDKARELLDDHDIEIWQGVRMVGYIVPDKKGR